MALASRNAGPSLAPALFFLRLVVGTGPLCRRWQERRRSRRALDRLDDRLLKDIGLDRDLAATECARPFWRD